MIKNMVSIVEKQTEIDCDLLTNIILEKEPQIINEYPPIGFYGNETDGDTGLGSNSLTSRFYHFNVLDWDHTDLIKQEIREGYDAYTGLVGTPIYVKCWANVMRKGEQIQLHQHSDDDLMYVCGHLSIKVDGSTATYYEVNGSLEPFENVNGRITFFPSYVPHCTNQYNGDSERITIAFDIKHKELFDVDIHPDAKSKWVRI